MSILIKNMKMPKCCDVCQFCAWSSFHQTAACEVHDNDPCFDDFSVEYREKRSNICPLVEFPEDQNTISRHETITRIQKAYIDTEDNTNKSAVNINVGLTKALHIMQDLPFAQFKRINKGIHEITELDKTSYAVICDKFPSPHIYFNTYDEAEHWAKFNQPNYRPFYIIKRSEHFEIVGEIK